jgi:hypothetical protein
MRSQRLFPLLVVAEWWQYMTGAILVLLALFGGWRGWLSLKGEKLQAAEKEIKTLKADCARLLREASVRIDNEQEYLNQIDSLQTKVAEQRTRINELLDGK